MKIDLWKYDTRHSNGVLGNFRYTVRLLFKFYRYYNQHEDHLPSIVIIIGLFSYIPPLIPEFSYHFGVDF